MIKNYETNNVCLFLTATISPKNTPGVARPEVELREKDYLDALEFYANFDLPIVFIENSNFLSKKIIEAGKKIKKFEYLCFSSQESFKGKGHGESEIFSFGFLKSDILKSSEWIFKISGRYILRNFNLFIAAINISKSEVIYNFSRKFTWCDTRIMIFKKSFYYEYFEPLSSIYLSDIHNINFEVVYARSIHQLMADGKKTELWPVYADFYAINGYNGHKIDFNWWKKLKYKVYYKLKNWIFKQTV